MMDKGNGNSACNGNSINILNQDGRCWMSGNSRVQGPNTAVNHKNFLDKHT